MTASTIELNTINNDSTILVTRIDSLENRVRQLEQKESTWQKIVSYMPKFSGYLQTGFNYNSYQKGTATFQVKRLRLIIDGTITPKATYKFQFEAFNGINVGSRWEKQKIIQILDAFVTYKFSNAFQLRGGQFSTPAGYENYSISPLTNVTVDYAPICSKMVLRNAVGYNYSDYGRDLGIMAFGDLIDSPDGTWKMLSYNFALTNGHLPTVNDNNKSKDIIAALTFWPIKKLNLKLAYNWGEYTPDTFSGNTDIDQYPWSEVGNNKYVPLHRIVLGAWYNNPSGLYIRTEYGHLTSTHKKVRLVNEDAVYLVAAYTIGKWQPVARIDYFRDKINPSLPDNRTRGLIGCNFIPNSHIKIQLNYLLSHYTAEASTANNGKRYSSELLLMGLFSF